VGAGPAGAACALELRRRGVGEVVLVDRSTYPRRKVCGSGLSPVALHQLEQLDMLDQIRPGHTAIRKLRAIGPGGTRVNLSGAKGAWVVPRSEFDNALVQEAVKRGAELVEGTRVQGLLQGPDGRTRGVRTRDSELEADLVVVANGSPSNFEIDPHPRKGVRTIMGWWEGRLSDRDADMIWDRRLGGYYAWAFPEPGDVINIGLTITEEHPRSTKLRELFGELLDEYFPDVVAGNKQLGRWAGHPATVTTRVGKIITPRTIYVGEAARLVCPATVEGISYAMMSGRMAADAIARRFDPDRGFSTFDQHRYRAKVAAKMLPMFAAGEAFYRIMRHPRAVGTVASMFDAQRLANRLSYLVGERQRAA
jgi:geranylgeranyl reductase family protein